MVSKLVPSMLIPRYFQNLGSDVIWLPVQVGLSFRPATKTCLRGRLRKGTLGCPVSVKSKCEDGAFARCLFAANRFNIVPVDGDPPNGAARRPDRQHL
jgi:hypothetical protein